MENRINAEIHIYSKKKAAVDFHAEIESGKESFVEILFFTCYTLRQLNNMGKVSLARDLVKAISRVDHFSTRLSPPRGMSLPALVPYPEQPAKHYFEARLVFGNGRYLFQMEPRGYGFISWHLYPHAAMSVLILGNYLSKLHPEDDSFWKHLKGACQEISLQLELGRSNLRNAPQLALAITEYSFS